DERERRRRDHVVDDHELHAAMTVEERAGDRTHEYAGREREERDRAGEPRRVEPFEREEHEDELHHRRRGPREQHAREETREARDLKKAPVARPRLGEDFGYRWTLPNETERSLRCIAQRFACAFSQSSRRTSPHQMS